MHVFLTIQPKDFYAKTTVNKANDKLQLDELRFCTLKETFEVPCSFSCQALKTWDEKLNSLVS